MTNIIQWGRSVFLVFVLMAVTVQAQHLRTGIIAQHENDSTWTDLNRLQWYFQAHEGRMDSLIIDDRNEESMQWVHQKRHTSTYQDTILVENLEENWDTIAGEWVLYERNTYTLNGTQVNETLTEQWDGGAWQPSEHQIFQYDGDGDLLETLHQLWDGTLWQDKINYVYSYDGNGNETVARTDTMSTGWETVEIDSSFYDAGNLKTGLHTWYRQSGGMALATVETYQYNANGELIRQLGSSVLSVLGLVPVWRTDLVQVGDGLTDLHQYYNTELTGGPDWIYGSRLLYDPDIFNGIRPIDRSVGLAIGPVPCTGTLDLWLTTGTAEVRVYDMQGRTVAANIFANGGHRTLDMTALTDGEYIIQVLQNGKLQSAPIIKANN